MKRHTSNRALIPVLAATVAVAFLVSGCGYLRQTNDTFYMDAVPAMREAQTLNPDAGRNHKVVTGLDAVAAQNVNESYEKSFIKAESTQKSAAAAFLGLSGLSNN